MSVAVDVFVSWMRSIWVTRGWFQNAASSPKTAIRKAARGIQRAARQETEKYQNARRRRRSPRMMVAIRSGVRAHDAAIGNSAQRAAPTMSVYSTSRMSHRRYAPTSVAHTLRKGFDTVFTTGLGVTFAVTAGAAGVTEGAGADVTTGFAAVVTGAAEGAVYMVVTGVAGTTTGPEPRLIEATVKHTGLPVRDESNVTLIGSVPRIGVVPMSTWTRSTPEASTRRVIKLNGIDVFPTEPMRATYEGSEMVKSNE